MRATEADQAVHEFRENLRASRADLEPSRERLGPHSVRVDVDCIWKARARPRRRALGRMRRGCVALHTRASVAVRRDHPRVARRESSCREEVALCSTPAADHVAFEFGGRQQEGDGRGFRDDAPREAGLDKVAGGRVGDGRAGRVADRCPPARLEPASEGSVGRARRNLPDPRDGSRQVRELISEDPTEFDVGSPVLGARDLADLDRAAEEFSGSGTLPDRRKRGPEPGEGPCILRVVAESALEELSRLAPKPRVSKRRARPKPHGESAPGATRDGLEVLSVGPGIVRASRSETSGQAIPPRPFEPWRARHREIEVKERLASIDRGARSGLLGHRRDVTDRLLLARARVCGRCAGGVSDIEKEVSEKERRVGPRL